MMNETKLTDALLRDWWVRDAQLKRETARRNLCIELIKVAAILAFAAFAFIITTS